MLVFLNLWWFSHAQEDFKRLKWKNKMIRKGNNFLTEVELDICKRSSGTQKSKIWHRVFRVCCVLNTSEFIWVFHQQSTGFSRSLVLEDNTFIESRFTWIEKSWRLKRQIRSWLLNRGGCVSEDLTVWKDFTTEVCMCEYSRTIEDQSFKVNQSC